MKMKKIITKFSIQQKIKTNIQQNVTMRHMSVTPRFKNKGFPRATVSLTNYEYGVLKHHRFRHPRSIFMVPIIFISEYIHFH